MNKNIVLLALFGIFSACQARLGERAVVNGSDKDAIFYWIGKGGFGTPDYSKPLLVKAKSWGFFTTGFARCGALVPQAEQSGQVVNESFPLCAGSQACFNGDKFDMQPWGSDCYGVKPVLDVTVPMVQV